MMSNAIGIPIKEINRGITQLNLFSYLSVLYFQGKNRTKLLDVKKGTVSKILKRRVSLTVSCRTLQGSLQG